MVQHEFHQLFQKSCGVFCCDNGKSPEAGDGTQGPDLAIMKATVHCLYYVTIKIVNDKQNCLECELLCCSAEKRQISAQPSRCSKIWFQRMCSMPV